MTENRLRASRVGIVGPLLGGHRGWVPSPGEALAVRLREDGRRVRTVSTVRRPLPRAIDTFARMLAWRGRVDVVVALVFSGKGFAVADLAGRLSRAWLRVPVVLWLHGGDLPRFATRRARWVDRVLGAADRIVAPSRYLIESLPIAADSTVIPNPIDLDRYTFRQRDRIEPRLLWMRTFHDIYQPEMALDTLARLRDRHPTARLTMAGQDRGELDSVRARARAVGLEASVDFPGFLDAAAKRRAFDAHDVFLNTNRVDNTPVTVIEAMASGLPVVSTDAGGLPYLIDHGHTGLLVPSTDADAMAAAVAGLIDDPRQAKRLSKAGREVAADCARDRVVERWSALLDGLVAPDATTQRRA